MKCIYRDCDTQIKTKMEYTPLPPDGSLLTEHTRIDMADLLAHLSTEHPARLAGPRPSLHAVPRP